MRTLTRTKAQQTLMTEASISAVTSQGGGGFAGSSADECTVLSGMPVKFNVAIGRVLLQVCARFASATGPGAQGWSFKPMAHRVAVPTGWHLILLKPCTKEQACSL